MQACANYWRLSVLHTPVVWVRYRRDLTARPHFVFPALNPSLEISLGRRNRKAKFEVSADFMADTKLEKARIVQAWAFGCAMLQHAHCSISFFFRMGVGHLASLATSQAKIQCGYRESNVSKLA